MNPLARRGRPIGDLLFPYSQTPMNVRLFAMLGSPPLDATAVTYDEWKVRKFTAREHAKPSLGGILAVLNLNTQTFFHLWSLPVRSLTVHASS
jgi:hypothetical protein